MKKPLIKLTLAASLSFGALGTQAVMAKPVEASQFQQNFFFDQIVTKAINANYMYRNIDHLAQNPRVAGTEAEDQAVEFIKQQFKKYGYKAEVQPFTFYGYTAPHTIELNVDGYEGALKPASFTYSVSGNVSGDLVYGGLGKPEELAALDLTGKIVLIKRGELSFGEKVLNAAAAGAAGVIIYNNASGAMNGTLGEASDDYVPAVALTKAEGEALLGSLEEKGTLTASLKVEGARTGESVSHNVVATKKPTTKLRDTKEIIVIGAHHDSVAGAPGANDDASGTAMTLELARIFKLLPTDTEIRFVTFGAEELGLLGSTHYVNSLSDDEKSRMVANFNLDMVGSKDAGDLVLTTLDGQPNLVTDLAQASSTRLNGQATPIAQGGRSDHVPFAEAGISAALFIHSPSEPWYHTPDDTIDKISKDKLKDVAKIVGSAVYQQAQIDRKFLKPKMKPQEVEPQLFQEQNIK
ncbi:M28 family peptidase [Cytobacillus purgationiresistens]|uniref:Aminopeptidase YwaD n=1 Tax=Cytobacillus purgationiresistens TaxID=863449 RepID=A0ABU0AQA7_9BACI|nr:M28 family peptidase [Cytobacillus purgationiresistens]MDQ0273459.1 aminopeptidase YwaD [Cytobacillus purgationiresistens]